MPRPRLRLSLDGAGLGDEVSAVASSGGAPAELHGALGPGGSHEPAVTIGADRFQHGGLSVDTRGNVGFTAPGGGSRTRLLSGGGGGVGAVPSSTSAGTGTSSSGGASGLPLSSSASGSGGAADTYAASQPPPPSASRQLSAVAFDDLAIEARLGAGASATVYRARHRATGQVFALKCIQLYEKAVRDQLIAELGALYAAECDALVGFYGATYREGVVAVVLEYMDLRGLDSVLAGVPGHAVPERALAGIAFQVLWGLGYLAHERRVHRDVKPANLLLDSAGHVKLTDFGISRQLQDSILARTFVGSFRYMSPERIIHKPYDSTSDVWAAGLVLLEAAVGRYPYPTGDDDDGEGGGGGPASQITMVMTLAEVDPPIPAPGEPPARLSPGAVAFLRGCLARDPAQRATAAQLLECEWFAQQGVGSLTTAQGAVREWLAAVGLSPAPAASSPTAGGDQQLQASGQGGSG